MADDGAQEIGSEDPQTPGENATADAAVNEQGYVDFIDAFVEGLGHHLADEGRTLGDDRLVADAAIIMNSALNIAAPLEGLRLDHVTQDLLDKPVAEQRATIGATASLLAAQEFVDVLAAQQTTAEQAARTQSKAIAEHRRAGAEAKVTTARQQQEEARRRITEHEQTLDELRRKREALIALGPNANELDLEQLDFDLQTKSLHLQSAKLDLGQSHALDGFYSADQDLAELFDEGYRGLAEDVAATRRATERRRLRSRRLRQLRFLAYAISLVVLGAILDPGSRLAAVLLGLVVWALDFYVIQPFLIRREAARRCAELQTEVLMVALLWVRLRSLQTLLDSAARPQKLPPVPLVPMAYFTSASASFNAFPHSPPEHLSS